MVYSEKPTSVAYLCAKDVWFHTNDNPKHSKISDNCYVWSSASARTICNILSYLFTETNIPKSQLEFDLVPQKENEVEESDNVDSELSIDFE